MPNCLITGIYSTKTKINVKQRGIVMDAFFVFIVR